MLKLYHKNDLIAYINNPKHDGLWMTGQHELLPAADKFKQFFAFTTDESKVYADDPFSEDIYENWTVESEDGVQKRIGYPAVHDDGEISWRCY